MKTFFSKRGAQKFLSGILIILIISCFTACHKTGCTAGSDGSLIVKASIVHHIKGIKGATLHIKYCATELPGTTNADYDLNIKGNDADTFVIVTGLKDGDYFLYGTGYDSTIVQNVVGGSSFNFSSSSDTLRPVIYVTE